MNEAQINRQRVIDKLIELKPELIAKHYDFPSEEITPQVTTENPEATLKDALEYLEAELDF